jgi:hypothetical protein
MEPLWIAISIIALVVIVVLLLIARGKRYYKPSNLAILGMSLVVMKSPFVQNRPSHNQGPVHPTSLYGEYLPYSIP